MILFKHIWSNTKLRLSYPNTIYMYTYMRSLGEGNMKMICGNIKYSGRQKGLIRALKLFDLFYSFVRHPLIIVANRNKRSWSHPPDPLMKDNTTRPASKSTPHHAHRRKVIIYINRRRWKAAETYTWKQFKQKLGVGKKWRIIIIVYTYILYKARFCNFFFFWNLQYGKYDHCLWGFLLVNLLVNLLVFLLFSFVVAYK